MTGYQLEISPFFNSKHKGKKDFLLYPDGKWERERQRVSDIQELAWPSASLWNMNNFTGHQRLQVYSLWDHDGSIICWKWVTSDPDSRAWLLGPWPATPVSNPDPLAPHFVPPMDEYQLEACSPSIQWRKGTPTQWEGALHLG